MRNVGRARIFASLFLCAALYAALGAPGSRSAAGPVLLGDTAIEAGADSNTAGQAEAFKTTASASGALGSLAVYIPTGSAATKLVAAVYGDTGGHPVSLLASGALTSPVAGAWNTVNLTASPQITAGAVYWIAILSPVGSGTLAFRDARAGGATEMSSQTNLTAFPASWTRGAVYTDGPVSAYGVASTVTPDTAPPSAPTGLAASSVTRTSLSLSWSASTDNVGVTGYDVFRNGVKLGTTTGTSTSWTGLTCGTTYTAAVDAYDAAGNTSAPTQITVTTAACPDTTPPSAPTGLAASSVTRTSLSLSWSASTDNVGVTGYDVLRNGVKLGTTTATSTSWTGLTCGTTYTAAVDAFDAAGNTSAPAQISVTTAACPDTTPPSAPTGLAASSVTQTSLTLSWTASIDNVGVAGYDVFRDASALGKTTATSTSWSGLQCGTTYTAAVDAYDAAGNTSVAAQITVTTAACVVNDTTPPSAPTGLAASSVTQSGLTLSWTASTDNVGVAGYDVLRNGTAVSTTAATSASWTGLTCGTTYTAAVDAYDTSGNRSPSTQITVTTAACPDVAAPSAPTGLAASGVTQTGLSLSWTASTDNVGVTGYEIFRNGTKLGTTTATSASWTGLTCGTTYTVAVDAYDAAGNTSAPTQITVTTAACPDTTPPSAPTGLAASSVTRTELSLSWAASTDNVGVTGYDVLRNGTKLGTTTGTSTSWTGLTCGTTYTAAVDAFDAAGNTSAPTQITVTTATCPDTTPPSAPGAVTQSGATATTVSVTWQASTDNTGVAGYDTLVNGTSRGTVAGTSTTFSGLACGTSYTVGIVAYDAAGNRSSQSSVTAATQACGSSTTPTPVPAAGVNGVTVGGGFLEASARQVLRTANNVVYVVTADDNPCQGGGSGVIRVEKGIGAQPGNPAVPTSFVEQDAANHPVSAASGQCLFSSATSVLFNPDSRLDRAGIIHLAFIDTASGTVYYQTFSTVSDTYGPRVAIATDALRSSGAGWPRGGQLALTLDANDVPGVVYATSGSGNSLVFKTRAGGVWSAGTTVASGTDLMHPSMVTALDGSYHLAWLENSLAAHATVRYARYDGISWTAPETVSSGDTLVLANGNDDQGPSIATDPLNRPHVLYMDGTVSGNDNYVRMRVRTGTNTWSDNTPPGGAGGASNPAGTWYAHTPQNYVSSSGTDFVFLGHDVNISPGGYQYQTGGFGNPWSAYSTLDPRNSTNTTAGAPGLDGTATIRFDPLRDNNAGIIDVLYYDEDDGTAGYSHHATIYYKAILIAPPDTSPPSTPSGLVQTGATATSVALAWNASTDDVGVTGYTLYNGATPVGSASSTTGTISGLACATTYTVGVEASDGAGNRSGRATASATTAACDTQMPTVSITAPAGGATVSGVVTVSASAADDTGVAGVQFKLDGANLGTEDTTAPYSVSWDSTTSASGAHTLTAVARDSSGNTTTSAAVNVTSQNAAPTGPAFVRDLGTVTAANSGGTLQLTVPAGGVPAGHAIVVWGQMSGSTAVTISSIADTRGNAYTADGAIANNGVNTMVGSGYIATALVAGDQITLTFSGNYYSVRAMRALEFTGLSATNRVGQKATGTGSSTAPTTALATAQANELLIGAIGTNTTAAFTPATGFTALSAGSATGSGVTRTIIPMYRIASPAGQYQARGTLATTSQWSAALIAYH